MYGRSEEDFMLHGRVHQIVSRSEESSRPRGGVKEACLEANVKGNSTTFKEVRVGSITDAQHLDGVGHLAKLGHEVTCVITSHLDLGTRCFADRAVEGS